jgi:hypothetical protein
VVVKTKDPATLIDDLKETFTNLHAWQWKLNLTKRVFGVPSWQLLGFLVSHHGIEASTKQICVITEMGPPHRFISWLEEKGLAFFKLLKKSGKSEWIEEANQAFEKLKAYLTSSPVLTPLERRENMMLYITATTMVASTAIVVEREEQGHMYKVQRPVYYISEVLSDSKVRYPHVQKLLYALLITSRKLRHYFDEHKITMVTDFPLNDILHNHDSIGCISKCAVKLGALNIEFTPCKAIKS